MKRTVLLLMAIAWAAAAQAQFPAGGERAVATVDGATVSPLCAELAGSDRGARVDVKIESGAVAALRYADAGARASSVSAFTVSLFRDNTQNARANTYAAAAAFAESFPGIATEVSYEAPWFKVTAGRFVERADAVALCGRVLARFPKAVVAVQDMTVQQIIESEKTVHIPTGTVE